MHRDAQRTIGRVVTRAEERMRSLEQTGCGSDALGTLAMPS